jgi:uncharacterized protein (TIGR00369 family)
VAYRYVVAALTKTLAFERDPERQFIRRNPFPRTRLEAGPVPTDRARRNSRPATVKSFTVVDPDFANRTRASFERQAFMKTIGATLEQVEPGFVEIHLPINPAITQQHGFVHAGAVASIADSACGYAAFTLMPADAGVLAVEFKINLMAPAKGELLIARGRVLRSGRTLSVCQAEVVALSEDGEKTVALLTSTVMTVRDREGVRG